MKLHKLVQSVAFAALVAGSATLLAVGIEAPADAGPEWRGPDGSTALQWAVYEGDVERVQQLIAAGADVTLANNYGSNAMQLASEVANVELLKLLLEAGADAYIPPPAQEAIRAALEAKPDTEVYVYPGRDHAFARPNGSSHHAADTTLANSRTDAFFLKHLF